MNILNRGDNMTNKEYWKEQASLIVKPSKFDKEIYEVEFDRYIIRNFITKEQLVEELNKKNSKVIILNKKGNKINYRNFLTVAEVH